MDRMVSWPVEVNRGRSHSRFQLLPQLRNNNLRTTPSSKTDIFISFLFQIFKLLPQLCNRIVKLSIFLIKEN